MTATSVPRGHRRGQREAEQNLEDEFATLEHEVLADLTRQPTPPVKERVPLRERPRLPVVRPVMTDPVGETVWAVGHVGNRVGHHVFRPEPFLCAAGRGARRAYNRVRDYIKMPSRQAVLTKLIADGETKKHARFAVSYKRRKKRQRDKVLRAAGIATGTLLAAVTALAVFLGRDEADVDAGTFLWNWALAGVPFVLAGVVALAVYGRKRGSVSGVPAPVKIDTRPFQKAAGRPTPEKYWGAFKDAGFEGIVCERPPSRAGAGWEVPIRLPNGKAIFDDAVRERKRIAGALGIPADRLFFDPVRGDRGSEKHLVLWEADHDPMTDDPPIHPFTRSAANRERFNLWRDGAPFGVDPRGEPIAVPLLWGNVLVVGQTRSGKSFSIGLLAIAPIADGGWDLDLIEFKGDQFFRPARSLARNYITSAEPHAARRTRAYLTKLEETVADRNRYLGSLPVDRCPEGKLTEDLARSDPLLRPRLVVIDEFQNAIDDPDHGTAILELSTRIARTAPSQGIGMAFGMQRAARASIDELRSHLGIRFALSVEEPADSRMALGRAHINDLVDASTIPRERPGVGFLSGARRPVGLVRCYGTDRGALEVAAKAAIAARPTPPVQLAKDDDQVAEAFKARVRPVLNGDEALTCAALGERLELGQGPAAAKKLAEQARAAGIEPQRDTTGRVTGSREALYIHRDQLN